MEITLSRVYLTPNSTCGELNAGNLRLYTLELPVKDGLPGSAIPPGRYRIELAPSPKFLAVAEHDPWVEIYAGQMPHIICPPRSLIMIHWLNRPDETEGCIGVGLTHDLDFIGESRKAFEQLFDIIAESARNNDCWITIKNVYPVELNMQGDV